MTTSAIHPFDGYDYHKNSDGSITLFDMQGNVAGVRPAYPTLESRVREHKLNYNLPKEKDTGANNQSYF